jgi:hypothetical protein
MYYYQYIKKISRTISYIQTINSETEAMVDSTAQLKREFADYTVETERLQKVEDQKRMELESKLKSLKDTIHAASETHKIAADGADQLCKKVQSLFFKLQCDQIDTANKSQPANINQRGKAVTVSKPDNKIALLVGQGSISEANVLEYLGIIEQRAVDIISEFIRDHHKDGNPTSPTPGPSTPVHHNLYNAGPLFDIKEFNEDEFFDGNIYYI